MSQYPTSNPGDASSGAGERASAAAEKAKEQAATTGDAARSQAQEVAHEASGQARGVAEEAKHEAQRLVHDSREHLMSQASEQTKRLAGSVREVSEQLQGMLSGGQAPHGVVADVTQQAAGATERLADQLESRRPEELVDEARRFARRRPGMFLLGAVGAGFVVGRLARTVDTQAIADAAKSGAQRSGGDGHSQQSAGRSTAGTQPLPSATAEFPERLTPGVRP